VEDGDDDVSAINRELAHEERLAGAVDQRSIAAPLLVLEDPPRDLSGEPDSLHLPIRLGDSREHEETGAAGVEYPPPTVTDASRTRCRTARTR
jgi:hypothetical protein